MVNKVRIKEEVKNLWRLCFHEDERFLELYFQQRYRYDNTMILQSGEEVISALQMLSYPMTFLNHTVPTAYISGACTHPEFQHKGVMKELLSQSFARMMKEGTLLSTLIPAEPWLYDYYGKSGYAAVFGYNRSVIDLGNCTPPQEDITVKCADSFEGPVYEYLNRKMLERPCCVQHTSEDFKVVLDDLALTGGCLFVAYRQNEVVGIAMVYPRNELYIDEMFADDEKIKEALLYTMKQQTEATTCQWIHPEKNVIRLGMIRIIDAKRILQIYAAAHPELEINIALSDNRIESNNGYYYINNGKCMAAGKDRIRGAHIELNMKELAERIFTPLHPYMSLMMN